MKLSKFSHKGKENFTIDIKNQQRVKKINNDDNNNRDRRKYFSRKKKKKKTDHASAPY